MTKADRRMDGWADGAALLALLLLSAYPPIRLSAQDTTAGRAVYEKWCAGCHGETGAGDGPAAGTMLPRPRDFTGAIYQIRTTASGQLPTDDDLRLAIDRGLPGTAMPGWKDQLSERDRRDVLAYLKTFSAFFADTTQRPEPLVFGKEPGGGTSVDALRIGRQFYDSIGCRKCHGDRGRGDGPSAPTLKDDAGFPVFAANLTENWRFNGGSEVADIYRRLRSGLDGTPMPSFSDLIDQQFLTEAELWRLAQYVRSLSPARPPEVRDVIHARQVAARLPTSPDDSVWGRVERYWVPLVGQVMRKSRWFTPAASGVWVQAVHDGQQLALRVSWDDRSQSPDSAWLEFTDRVLETVARDDSTPPAPTPWPDQLAVQFPLAIPEGFERPFFLMGAATRPVYQWRWTSTPGGVREDSLSAAVAGLARGIDRFDPLPGTPLSAQAVYDQGEWRVVFSRSLATADTANQLHLRTGRAIPVAFFAWDGSNGETGTRMAVSTWYFLALDTPVRAQVFVSPILAAALALGLGLTLVRRAQRPRSQIRRRSDA
ncbi:MAG: c-type cytochrome [Gemmatimonadetes bacterium]|nr:c-type cytochrome [Gemmatimonadota bacterium]